MWSQTYENGHTTRKSQTQLPRNPHWSLSPKHKPHSALTSFIHILNTFQSKHYAQSNYYLQVFCHSFLRALFQEPEVIMIIIKFCFHSIIMVLVIIFTMTMQFSQANGGLLVLINQVLDSFSLFSYRWLMVGLAILIGRILRVKLSPPPPPIMAKQPMFMLL